MKMKQAVLYPLCILLFFCGSCRLGKEQKLIQSVYTDKWVGVGHSANDWLKAHPISFEKKSESDNKVTVCSLWDHDSLYFRIEVEDKDLRAYQTEKDHPELYKDDMVEILIDAFNDKNSCWSPDDIVYHINLYGQKKDDRGTEQCESNEIWDGEANYVMNLYGTLNDAADTDRGYRLEIAFPWTELQVQPKAGTAIGINFANGDNDGNGRQLFDWSGAWPLRTPSDFGILVLK